MSDRRSTRGAIVTGAKGLVGCHLLPQLVQRGFAVQAVSRQAPTQGGPVAWREVDLQGPPGRGDGGTGEPRPSPRGGCRLPLTAAEIVFHAAPLWLLPPWLTTLAGLGVQRLVAFSSTSRLTKESSGQETERETARKLADAEAAVARVCDQEKIRWTVFRPTLIYGGGRDRNVADIARVIRWLGFFPMASRGRGRRQPVHAEDLARACLAVVDKPATFGQVYELPGGETLTYVEMVSRIARDLGRKPRLLHVPRPMLRAALNVARRLPGLAHLTPEMATRMDQDLVFDAARARHDFGYAPRPFRPTGGLL